MTTKDPSHNIPQPFFIYLCMYVCIYFWWEHLNSTLLGNFSCTVLVLSTLSHLVIHWIFRPFSSYNWKSVPFINLSLFPTLLTTTFLLSVSMSLTFFFIPHIRDTMKYLSFSVCLISLSIMPSSFTHVVINVRISLFLMLNNIPLYMYTTNSWSVHPLMNT